MNSTENLPDRSNPKASRCPLCGGPNQCALAADPLATECWCDGVKFPKELLALVPNAAKRKICVCRKCLMNYHRSTKAA